MRKLQKSILLTLALALSGMALQAQDCHILNIERSVTECGDDSSFYVDIQFEVENPGESGFRIRGNGQEYGNFEYGDSVYHVGPLTGDCMTLYEFVIIDNENDDCHGVTELAEPVCCGSHCSLELFDIVLGPCDSTGYRSLQFNVNNESGADIGFDVLSSNIPLTRFNYGMNPYTIEVPGGTWSHNLSIRDAGHPDCTLDIEFTNAPCEVEFECPSWPEFSVSQEFECTGENTYEAYSILEYNGESDSLWLAFYSHDNILEYLERVAVHDFPYYLGEFEHSDQLYYYSVHEQLNIFCSTGSEWNDAPDCDDYEECVFNHFEYDLTDCNESGQFRILFSFETDSAASDGFYLIVNNTVIDSFQYGQLIYETGLIDALCDHHNRLTLVDISSECQLEESFESPECCEEHDCEIDDIRVYDFDCNDDGSYDLVLDFEYEHVSNEFFDVWAGDHFIGFYAYHELPVHIEGFLPRDVEYDLIKICDNDNPACCAVQEFHGPDCDDKFEDCSIFDFFYETYQCSAAGTYLLDFEFDIENPGDEGFLVIVNDHLVDSFSYGQVYYTVGPLNCSPHSVLSIIDIENDCGTDIDLDTPDCCGVSDCFIGEITVGEFDCHDDGSYSLILDFDYDGVTNDYFDVWAGNIFAGYYAYADLPVRIDSFYPRDVEYDLIRICDNDNPECCAVKEFMGPDCDEEFEDCPISELHILESHLTANGNIIVLAEFELSIDRPVGLDIYANGHYLYYERETESPLEIILEGFDTQDSIEIKLCLNDHPDCCIEAAFLPGENRDCALFDLEVLQTICKDGFFYLVVDAEHGFGLSDQRFELRGNGNEYGYFALSHLPIALGPFHIDESIDEMEMIIHGFENCSAETELDISCECTTNIIEIDSEEFSISETGTHVIIENARSGPFTVSLYTLDGKQLLSGTANGYFSMDKLSYTPGIYILNITYNGTQKSFKLFMSN